jgi:hypothetical protein
MNWPALGAFVQQVGIPFAALLLVAVALGGALYLVLVKVNGKLDRVAGAVESNTAQLGKVEHAINNWIQHQAVARHGGRASPGAVEIP